MSEFDVFLCYNRQDEAGVVKIARQLQQQGLKPWLDIWELPPGISWQERLEEQIEQIKSAAVIVGNSGLGPWQKREIRAFLTDFIDRGVPVIPVLLENAPKQPSLPILLKSLTWVDFRQIESNYSGNCGETTPVGQYRANNFGLFDMHGNVWEWCEDNWHDNYRNAPTDGKAWLKQKSTKVMRGGSWDYNPSYCRSACRNHYTRVDREVDIGFRVICIAPKTI